jgi:hypothetical protein
VLLKIGRLVERGLHDELAGSAYAIVDGADGRVHHLRFNDLQQTGDAAPGAIVELRQWQGDGGRLRMALATRSDLTLARQIQAPGATWLDRELVAREGIATGNGFGAEIRSALEKRTDHLEKIGLAHRHGQGVSFERDLIARLRDRDMEGQIAAISARTGLTHRARHGTIPFAGSSPRNLCVNRAGPRSLPRGARTGGRHG